MQFEGRDMRTGYRIVVPSRGRADSATTHSIFGNKATYYVPSKELAAYRRKGINAVGMDIVDENVTKKRNAILSLFKMGEKVLFLDDDIKYFVCKLGEKVIKIDTYDRISGILDDCFSFLEEQKLKLFSFYCTSNPFFLKKGFARRSLCVSQVFGVIVSHLRFDERLTLKEDFDFSCQNLAAFGGVCRFNFIAPVAKKNGGSGGCSLYRNADRIGESVKYLLKKWPEFLVMHKTKNDVYFKDKVKNGVL